MKKIGASKFFLCLLDIIIIGISAVITNVLLTEKGYILTAENKAIIINSIISSIIVYEIYLHIFKTYRHITKFENGIEYLTYIYVCFISGVTLMIGFMSGLKINTPRKQLLGALITSFGIIGLRIIVRFFLKYFMREKESNDGQKYNVLIIGAGYAGRERSTWLMRGLLCLLWLY